MTPSTRAAHPHPALAPYVGSLVAYDTDLGGPGVHMGLPSTSLTFVLPVGEPLDVGWATVPSSRAQRWSTVSGLHVRPAEIHHDGHQHGIQLGLSLAGARALLGVPAAALVRELLTLDELLASAPGLAELPERVSTAKTDLDRVRIVERALLDQLTRRPPAPLRSEVGRALARLTRADGLDRVDRVAREVGFSRRRLSTLVRAECGLTPKELQRVARFDRSKRLLSHDAGRGRVDLAGLAARSGYADQPHLSREWTAMAGLPPARWLKEEFPFLQDHRDGAGEGGDTRRTRSEHD